MTLYKWQTLSNIYYTAVKKRKTPQLKNEYKLPVNTTVVVRKLRLITKDENIFSIILQYLLFCFHFHCLWWYKQNIDKSINPILP
jgi:hypothetical protein